MKILFTKIKNPYFKKYMRNRIFYKSRVFNGSINLIQDCFGINIFNIYTLSIRFNSRNRIK